MESNIETKLERAREQRLKALKNAFQTIDCFAEPSLNPDLMEKYDEVKQCLINQYSANREE